MNEEKLMILKMLEQGKITSNEAAELLNAIKDKNSGKSVSRANEFSKKVETLSRDLEPKLKKATKSLLDKTAYFADKLSKTISESNSFSSIMGGEEKTLEIFVGKKDNAQLRLNAKNGLVYIKGYNGDKITAKINYITKDQSQKVELVEAGSTFYLNYDEVYFNKVAIEAFVPETLFTKLYIETNNDKVIIDGFKAEEMNVYTSKGIIDIKNITVGKLDAETNNGKIILENLIGKSVQTVTSNEDIEIKQCNVSKVKLFSTNAGISLDAKGSELREYDFYEWHLETSNGEIKVNTLKDPRVAYDIKASTSLNGVQINLPNMNYKENEKNYVKANSYNYSMAAKKINLDLETSNAPIIVL